MITMYVILAASTKARGSCVLLKIARSYGCTHEATMITAA